MDAAQRGQEHVHRQPLRRLGQGREVLRDQRRHRPARRRRDRSRSPARFATATSSTGSPPGRSPSAISSRAGDSRRGPGLRARVPLLRERRLDQALHRLRRLRHPRRAQGADVPRGGASARPAPAHLSGTAQSAAPVAARRLARPVEHELRRRDRAPARCRGWRQKTRSRLSSCSRWSSTAARMRGVRACSRSSARPETGQRQEASQPLGVLGEEGQRRQARCVSA